MKRTSINLAPGYGRTIHHFETQPAAWEVWAVVGLFLTMIVAGVFQ